MQVPAPIKLGIMPPLTGIVGMYGGEISRAAALACDEVNEAGGLLGRRLELVIEDDGSLPESAVSAAERLVHRGCAALIGNLLSNARIAVAYRVAELRRVPLLNFSFYEGSILSRWFFHFAALPNQQIDRMIPFMRHRYGGRMFFAGNAYEWPRGSIAAAKRALLRCGGEVVGEEYLPIGASEPALDALVARVAAARPDVFVPYFAGTDQTALLRLFHARGLKRRTAVVMGHYDEVMASTLEPEVREGLYSSNTYFMTVETPENRRLLSRLAAAPGVTGLWPRGDAIVTNFGEGAYVCVKAFAAAAEQAGSVEPAALAQALSTVSVAGPQGVVRMTPDIQHAVVSSYLSRCGSDGAFAIVESFGSIEPTLPDRYRHERLGRQTTLEDELRLQTRIFAQLSEAVIVVSAADGTVVYNNAAAEALFGCDEGELLGHPVMCIDEARPPQAPNLGCGELARALARTGSWRGEEEGRRKNGAPLWCAVKATAFTHPFHGEVWLASCSDVSEKRRLSRELARERDYAARLLETAPAIVLLLDPEGRIEHVNHHFEQLTGFSLAEIRGEDWFSTFLPTRDRARLRALFASATSGAGVRGNINPIVTRDGSEREIEWHARVMHDPDGANRGVLNVGIDVTERMRAENALRESEARYQRAERATNDGLWEWNIATGAVYCSPRWWAILGYEPNDLRPHVDSFAELIHPEERGEASLAIERLSRSTDPFDLELRMRRKDGEYMWVRARGQITHDSTGEPALMTWSISNISRQKLAEVRLREAHALAGLGAWELDISTQTPWWSPEQYVLNGIEPGAPLTIQTFLSLVHPEDRARIEDELLALLTGSSIELDYRIVRPDGETRHMHGVVRTIRDAAGRPIRLSGTNLDVTSRVRAEEAIRRSLAEKEMLLREIHHRVKNNLQIVSSLLYFQTKKVRSLEDMQALVDLRQRISAMSLVHERLYLSHDVAQVDFAAYVRALVAEIARSSRSSSGFLIEVAVDAVLLPIELAIPAGLIVCELVTNICKYAFPHGQSGRASVSVRQRGTSVALTVDDDGVGFPAGFNPHASGSFGWDLVRSLVRQLDGLVSLGSGPGAHVHVTFPVVLRA